MAKIEEIQYFLKTQKVKIEEFHFGYQRVRLSLKPADLLPILKFSKVIFWGSPKWIFDDEKPNFYNVFKHISHFKRKTVYTFEAFF